MSRNKVSAVYFFIGLIFSLVSFFIPTNSGQGYVTEDVYGYDFALTPFDGEPTDLSDLWDVFLMVITNIAMLVAILTFSKYTSRVVSALNVFGSGVAIYWFFTILKYVDFHPWATLLWTIGSILITIGYELKRRH